jgi:hypothetical protein
MALMIMSARTEAQLRAEARYKASGKRPARVQVKLTLTPTQAAELDRQRHQTESRPAALLRLAGVTAQNEEYLNER